MMIPKEILESANNTKDYEIEKYRNVFGQYPHPRSLP